jgi:hypothetical protein
MRRYGEPSKDQERLLPHQFCSDCNIATRGYDFREGHGSADRKHHITGAPRRIASPIRASLSFRYTQPTAASRFAIAAPMPLEAPVTIATLPVNSLLLSCQRFDS